MQSLKIAELYAELEIRTTKFDSQLSALQAKASRFKMPAIGGGGTGDPGAQLFPLAKLQAAGLKYQDEVAKQADKAAKAVKAAKDKMAKAAASSASKGATSAMSGPIPGTNGQFIPLAGMQVAGAKYASAIQAAADKAAAATKAGQEKIDRASDVARTRSDAKNARWQAREVARIRSENQAKRTTREQMAAGSNLPGPSLSLVSDTDIDDQFTRSQMKAGGKSRFGNMNLAGIGGFLDDAQYIPDMGLRPVLNNVMAIAPAAGIALLAIDQLRKHWMDLQFLWGGNATKTQAEQMEELRDATARTAAETAKLAKYDRERAAAKDQSETATEAESTQTKSVNEAFVNAPLENVNKTIKALFMDDIAGGVDRKKIDEMTGLGKHIGRLKADQNADPEGFSPARQQALSGAIAAREKIEKELQVYIDEWVDKFRGKIATDPQSLENFTKKLEESGRDPALARKLREAQQESKDATPEGQRKKQLMESVADAEEAALQAFHDRDEARRASTDPKFAEWRRQDQLRRSMQPEASPSSNRAFGDAQGMMSRLGIGMGWNQVDPDDLSKGKTLGFGVRQSGPLANGLGRMLMGGVTGGLPGLMNLAGGANQLSGGLLGNAAMAAIKDRTPEMRFGGSAADFGSKLQQDILDKRKDDALLKINGTQVDRLTEIRDNLRGAFKNIGGALLGPA